MKPNHLDVPAPSCNLVSTVLASIGDKWALMVIVVLEDASQRFSELKRRINTVSQKMLTSTLRNLEPDGFVKREVTPTRPPRVDYELTNGQASFGARAGDCALGDDAPPSGRSVAPGLDTALEREA